MFLTEALMLTPQEVMVTGTYRLDSRGAERRWLPPTLPNCEHGLSDTLYYVQERSLYVTRCLFSHCLPLAACLWSHLCLPLQL